MKHVLAVAAVLASAGCAQTLALSASRDDLPIAQVITLTSQAKSDILIRRAVANGRPDDVLCTRALEQSLAPGQSITVTFIGCGKVRDLAVETGSGVKRFDWR